MLHSVLALGWTVVCPDSRVLPESNGFAVIEDVLAACRWIVDNPSECGHSASEANSHHIPDVVFAGASAGGWCALVAALHFCAQPSDAMTQALLRPKALLLLYPMLCLSSTRWCKPIFLTPEPMCEITAQSHLALAEQRIRVRETSLGEPFPTSEEEMRTRKRLPLLWAIMQSGRWLDYLTGVEGFAAHVESHGIEAATKKWKVNQPEGDDLKQLFPLDFADFKDFSAAVPTIIVHGTKDREVPISESEELVRKIKDARAPGFNTGVVRLYSVEDAGHVFDLDIDSAGFHITASDMEKKGVNREHMSALKKALRDLRIIVEGAS